MSRAKIIEIATAELGTKEEPQNSNKTKYGEWFGLNGVAWCGIFCSWCYAQAGHPLGIVDYYKGFASVPFALKKWKSKITKEPRPASLVCFDWNADQSPDHVGLFVRWLDKEKGLFETIEGNTSSGNNSNGGQVQRRPRELKNVEAFIDPLNIS